MRDVDRGRGGEDGKGDGKGDGGWGKRDGWRTEWLIRHASTDLTTSCALM